MSLAYFASIICSLFAFLVPVRSIQLYLIIEIVKYYLPVPIFYFSLSPAGGDAGAEFKRCDAMDQCQLRNLFQS
jgi:hypothetical protein